MPYSANSVVKTVPKTPNIFWVDGYSYHEVLQKINAMILIRFKNEMCGRFAISAKLWRIE